MKMPFPYPPSIKKFMDRALGRREADQNHGIRLRDPVATALLRAFEKASRPSAPCHGVATRLQREVMLREARHQAGRLGVEAPTLQDIVLAERRSLGQNLGAAWAVQIAHVLRTKPNLEQDQTA